MPELPEVETIVRELQGSVVGTTIVSAEIHWEGAIGFPDPHGFVQGVSGRRLTAVTRRGKWIIVGLGGCKALLVHLRMTGRLLISEAGCEDPVHVRVRLGLDDGRAICFHDVRKFGRMCLLDDPGEVVGALGPEPLDQTFTAAALGHLLAGRSGRIKPLLLNQRLLAGLGNIYTDEALWRAGIHPLRKANGLNPTEVTRLWTAIREVLQRALDSGGTTLDDGGFVGAAGKPGRFARRLAVYGRAGDVCLKCGSTVERIVVSQRGTHICPACQAAPAACEGRVSELPGPD